MLDMTVRVTNIVKCHNILNSSGIQHAFYQTSNMNFCQKQSNLSANLTSQLHLSQIVIPTYFHIGGFACI
jgi:hypothetical protein